MLLAAESNLPIAEQRQPRKHLLDGRVVANLFLEDSTRTRCSFETAVHRLGGQVFTLTAVIWTSPALSAWMAGAPPL